jgi:acetyltransferase-like isoleucine patch superfamily enzyme
MKRLIKHSINLIFVVLVFPLILLYWFSLIIFRNDNAIFASFSQLLSLLPGKIGSYTRCGFYRFAMTKCDTECVIAFATIFSQVDIEIEAGTYIGPQCNIGMCKIEKNCLIGSGVHILSGKRQHNFTDLEVPIKDQGGCLEKVSIGEDTWVGNGSLIMANVGKQCIVAAGSVVVNDVPDYSVVAGNPAKTIKSRRAEISAG